MYGTLDVRAGQIVQGSVINPMLPLYEEARSKGRMARLWSSLILRSNRLLDMNKILKGVKVLSRHYAGLQAVSIDDIQGSEGRSRDFDRNFYPVKTHNRARWLGIANARAQGKPLEAVDLIKIDDIYVVRDGHHRISVAKALGAESIDAHVTVWEVEDE